MKIYVYPADLTGCGYFRLIWPAEAMKAKGFDVSIMNPGNRAFSAGIGDKDQVISVSVPTDADVVVLQRVTHRHIAESIPIMRHSGIAVVVDIDDDLSTIHPRHPAFVNLHPNKNPDKVQNKNSLYHDWHNTANACRDATIVTTSSDALKDRYARHGRYFVIRNYLPETYLDIPHEDSDLVGWGGSVMSHPDDLDIIGWAIQQLVSKGHRFRNIGPVHGVAEALGLKDVDATGAIGMLDWPKALNQLGIGIAPLRDNKFNQAKSWLKPLEYAGLGIPCVMSPRQEYRAIHKLGIGVLADKPDKWFKALRRLVEDDAYRRDMSAQARATAETMTIPLQVDRWIEAWETAYEMTK